MVSLAPKRVLVGAVWPGALVLAAACGPDRSPPLVQPVGETHTYASSTGGARPQGQDLRTEPVSVVVAADMREVCELPDEPKEAPLFEVDSARLRPRGEDILARVARCITTNKLGTAPITIVGHTDPRGAAEYNEQLGLYRAAAAKQHLVALGVPATRIAVESRGAIDARGSEPASWALDRRVEVRLIGSGPSPLQRSLQRGTGEPRDR